jgi:hypothetical protein
MEKTCSQFEELNQVVYLSIRKESSIETCPQMIGMVCMTIDHFAFVYKQTKYEPN